VHRDAAPARGVDEVRQVAVAARADDRLRRLDHQLELQRARREPEARLERVEQVRQRRDLLGHDDLRERDDEASGQRARGCCA
jgi:hypothetical protein